LAYNVNAVQLLDEVVKRGWNRDAVNLASLVRQVRQVLNADALS
jgi:hypothetical protein